MSGETDPCPRCGAPVPSWAPAGNCPACLLAGIADPPTAENSTSTSEITKETIGLWELGERIGEGAFGVVFSARQSYPVRRTAALKILRPGMATKEVLARFSAESQALAMLEHPDVVSVFDVGSTEDGRPYFAMEYVPGVPVTEFAKDFTVEQKLGLFERICTAVEHAHRRGIIHRDLKPANILAYRDDEGKIVVKLLDFGIAKATEDILTQATVLTREGHFLGTPEYMSPEQAAGGDVDTRSDVYSLGVILFELLTGRPPHIVDSRSLDAVLRLVDRVRDEPAPTPSSVAGELANSDLDWITCKAIERDRKERYQSVREFREDILRFRSDQPIQARPRDTLYIARKYFVRHWKLAVLATATTALLIAAAIVSTVMAVRAVEATREAKSAHSLTDLRSAVEALDDDALSKTISLLVRSLKNDPENRESTMLLRSTLDSFPPANLVRETNLGGPSLRHAFFHDERGSLVTISERGVVRFWNRSGEPTAEALEIWGTNQIAAISPDQRRIVVCDIQGTIMLVELGDSPSATEARSEMVVDNLVTAVVFSPDGERFCVGNAKGEINFWHFSGQRIEWKQSLPAAVTAAAFSYQGSRVVLCGSDGKRYDLDAETGELLEDIEQQEEGIAGLVESGTSFRYYTISKSGVISAVDPGWHPRDFTSERVDIPVLLTASDPMDRLTAYASDDELSVWRVKDNVRISRLKLPDTPTSLAVYPKRNLAIIGTGSAGVLVWNFETRRRVGMELHQAKNAIATHLDADGERLLAISRDGILREFRLVNPEPRSPSTQRLPPSWEEIPLENRNEDLVNAKGLELPELEKLPEQSPRSAGLTSDGRHLFAAFRDGVLRIWDTESGALISEAETQSSSVRSVDASHDGELLVFRSRFGRFATYDRISGEIRQFTHNGGRDISSLAFSPDGETLAAATDGGVISLFSIISGEQLTGEMAHDVRGTVSPHFCRFSESQNGRLLTWGAPDRSFRQWHPHSGLVAGPTITVSGVPKYASYLPGGRILYTVEELDREEWVLRLWSADTGIPVTPEEPIDVRSFDFAALSEPDDGPLDAEVIEEIARKVGISKETP